MLIFCFCCCDWSLCPLCACRQRRSKSTRGNSKTSSLCFGFMVSISDPPHFGFLSWTNKSWMVTSLCLHAISERRNQCQDQDERACARFLQRRRAVLHPADAATPPPPSRRDVSLICAVEDSLCRAASESFNTRTLRHAENCSTPVLLLLRRPASELTVYSTVNLPATNPVSQSADLSQNTLKHKQRYWLKL